MLPIASCADPATTCEAGRPKRWGAVTAQMRVTDIRLRTKSRVLEVAFDDGAGYSLPFEYLRVYSPSAEVRGHGPGQETLQLGKHEVVITAVEPVGHYAVRLKFDDGHDTGLYSWEYLRELGETRDAKWQHYLDRLAKLGIPYPTPVPARR